MSKGVAQSLATNDPQGRDEIGFDGSVLLIDHSRYPFRQTVGQKTFDSSLQPTILAKDSLAPAEFCVMQLFYLAIMATSAFTVRACSSPYMVRCKEGYQLAVHDSLYFGTAKPDGVVSAEDWARFLESIVTPRFPQGLTSTRASGQWRGPDGEIVREDSHVLQLLHPDDEPTEKPFGNWSTSTSANSNRTRYCAQLHIRALRSSRLMKKTHMLRCRSIASLQRTVSTP